MTHNAFADALVRLCLMLGSGPTVTTAPEALEPIWRPVLPAVGAGADFTPGFEPARKKSSNAAIRRAAAKRRNVAKRLPLKKR